MAIKPKQEDKAVAAPPSKELQLAQLSQEDMASMYGDMGKEHISIPRLTILEQLSPEVGDNLGKPGDFFIKGLNQNLGPNPLELVVLMRSHSRMSWTPLAEGGGIICQAADGNRGVGLPGGDCNKCPNKEWQGKAKPLCDLYENFIVVQRSALQAGEAFPMAISGSRTKLKALRDFNTILMQSIQKRRPLFAKSYKVSTVVKQNPKIPGNNKYHVFQITAANENQVLPIGEQQEAFDLFKSFSGKSFSIQQDEPGTDSAPAPAPDGAPSI